MATQQIEHDSGSDFQSPMDAVRAATQPAPEAEAEGATPTATEEAQIPSWAENEDPVDDAAEVEGSEVASPGTEESDEPSSTTIEVKGAGKTKEFDLSPDNEDLKKTLQWGMVAPKWRKERDAARRETKELRQQLNEVKPLQEANEVWEQIQELTQQKQYDRVVRAVLGDAYGEFEKSMRDYVLADGNERAEIDRQRSAQEAEWRQTQAQKNMQKKDEDLEKLREEMDTREFRGYAQSALAKYDMSKAVDDKDVAHQLNQRMWRLALADLEDQAETDDVDNFSARDVAKAFARQHKFLTRFVKRQARREVAKQETAARASSKQQLSTQETPRKPAGVAAALDGWDGRRSKELLRRLVGSK